MEPLWFFLASEQRRGHQDHIPRSEHGWHSKRESTPHGSFALAKQKDSRLTGRSFWLKRHSPTTINLMESSTRKYETVPSNPDVTCEIVKKDDGYLHVVLYEVQSGVHVNPAKAVAKSFWW
jgi:hypothetical protein